MSYNTVKTKTSVLFIGVTCFDCDGTSSG